MSSHPLWNVDKLLMDNKDKICIIVGKQVYILDRVVYGTQDDSLLLFAEPIPDANNKQQTEKTS